VAFLIGEARSVMQPATLPSRVFPADDNDADALIVEERLDALDRL